MQAVIKIYRNEQPYYELDLREMEVFSAAFSPTPGVTYEETKSAPCNAARGQWFWQLLGEYKYYPMKAIGGKELAYIYINDDEKKEMPFSIEDGADYRIEVLNGMSSESEKEIWA